MSFPFVYQGGGGGGWYLFVTKMSIFYKNAYQAYSLQQYIHKVHKKYFHIKRHRENYVTCQNCDVTISIKSQKDSKFGRTQARCKKFRKT